MHPTAHPNQKERLNALHSYQILDTDRDPAFDEIVELAAEICDAPVSVINLIDEHRQWFKAEVGIGARETPLETSLCAHVILQDEFVEVGDTLSDPRFCDNPLCLDENGFRFYAGAQLIDPQGLPIGTLCVLDHNTRALTDFQRKALRVLSRQVMHQLELRRALEQQQVLRHEVDHRVKNSLQTVSSIIGLYGRTVGDSNAAAVLKKVKTQVESISALHAELQSSDNAFSVNLQAFLGRICELLQETAPANIEVESDLEKIIVGSETANALGIIANEFVANAIKHGFPDGRKGTVWIALKDVGDGLIRLSCHDNGLGSAVQPNTSSRSEALGRSLMETAALQIEGELSTELGQGGSRLTLEFRPE
ncbi:histidine kinase dimerization/phosphoacceptor domain -containing protein [Donghicola sp. XS_ASV15]|uniref:histidine kinase dimerization/phosphoacceptor domain -containing protein n=1 Tax=Donghicola sp. XS_ASV15 TaxID=3241295 RepID=UPI0035134A20